MDAELQRLYHLSQQAYANNHGDEARSLASSALQRHYHWGPGWWALACAEERLGHLRRADHYFRRAENALDEPLAAPTRIPWRRFVALVDQAIAELPSAIRAVAAELPVCLDDYTPAYFLDESDEYELLGLFSGTPRPDLQAGINDSGPTIHLWRRPHEHACDSMAELIQEVRHTYYHELAHYLGYDEDGVAALGLA